MANDRSKVLLITLLAVTLAIPGCAAFNAVGEAASTPEAHAVQACLADAVVPTFQVEAWKQQEVRQDLIEQAVTSTTAMIEHRLSQVFAAQWEDPVGLRVREAVAVYTADIINMVLSWRVHADPDPNILRDQILTKTTSLAMDLLALAAVSGGGPQGSAVAPGAPSSKKPSEPPAHRSATAARVNEDIAEAYLARTRGEISDEMLRYLVGFMAGTVESVAIVENYPWPRTHARSIVPAAAHDSSTRPDH